MIVFKIAFSNIRRDPVQALLCFVCVVLSATVISALCGFIDCVSAASGEDDSGITEFLAISVSLAGAMIIRSVFMANFGYRVKMLGLLASVGMGRLSRAAVILTENLVYGISGSLAGVFIGRLFIRNYIVLYNESIQEYLSQLYGKYYGTDIAIRNYEYVSNAGTVLLAFFVCILSVLIASLKPLLTVRNMSAVDSFKGERRIYVSYRESFTERLFYRCFGHIGRLAAKNYNNNAPRCRAVSFALSGCSILFSIIYALAMGRSWKMGIFDPFEASPDALSVLWMGAAVSVIALVGAMGAVIANINSRTREFAAFISIGMSKKELFKLMLLECSVVFLYAVVFGIAGSGLAVLAIYSIGSASGGHIGVFHFPYYLSFGYLIIDLLFCLFYVFCSARKVKHINIVNAIKN